MKKPLVIALVSLSAAALAAAGIGAFGMRGLVEEALTHEKEITASDLTEWNALRESDEPAGATAQRAWMADDAADIRLRFVTTQEPGWNIRFDSTTGLTPELLSAGGCTPTTKAGPPVLKVDWIPSSIQGTTYFCSTDQAYVAQHRGTVFGWQSAGSTPRPQS